MNFKLHFDKLSRFFKIDKFVFNKKKKIFLIALIVLFIVIIASVVIYIFFFEKNVSESKGSFNYGKIMSNYSTSFTNEDIIKPLTDDGYTFSFWILIKDFYKNNGYWKHIFHKGTPISKGNILDYSYWDNLSIEIDNQSPGLWMHENKPSLRFAFTSLVVEENEKSSGITEHAFKINYAPDYTSDSKDGLPKETIEYIDINNIPINKLTHIVMILDRNIVTIFMNGKIIETKNFAGKVKFNNGETYFSYEKTYNGYIDHFTYIPKVIKPKDVKKLYFDKPTLEIE